VGKSGGSCTCPDGSVYQVGNISSSGCGSLACINGKSGACNSDYGEWSYRKVVCSLTGPKEYSEYCLDNAKIWYLELDTPETTITSISYVDFDTNGVYGFGVFTNPIANQIILKAPGVGVNGGSCLCPDGSKYEVGIFTGVPGCQPACIGGIPDPSVCKKWENHSWSNKKVICDTAFAQKFVLRGYFDATGMIFKGKIVMFNQEVMRDKFLIGTLWKDGENVWIDGKWTDQFYQSKNIFRLKGPIVNVAHIPEIVAMDPANLTHKSCMCPTHKPFYLE
jgi:hypothetical protein